VTWACIFSEDIRESGVEAIALSKEETGEEYRASETVLGPADRLAGAYSVWVSGMLQKY